MPVRETLKFGCAGLGVSFRIIEAEPIPNIQKSVSFETLRDMIIAVAGGSPDGVFDHRVLDLSAFAVEYARYRVQVLDKNYTAKSNISIRNS